jgi:molecular chaperone GrpE (heat shock protein)
MSSVSAPKISKWPFFIGDLLLLTVASYFVFWSPHPLLLWQNILCVASVALAALFGVWPFLAEYRAAVKFAEAGALAETVAQIQKVEAVAEYIKNATGQWQTVQEYSTKSVDAAQQIAQRMSDESRAFAEFLQKANDAERNHLRLEVEKLRRSEGDWLQILVRILDHVYALYSAALKSGQPGIIEQIGNFQNACRDAARRAGLNFFTAAPSEPFDASRHQTIESGDGQPENAVVTETIAVGYTFQGQLLRPALVKLGPPAESSPAPEVARPAAPIENPAPEENLVAEENIPLPEPAPAPPAAVEEEKPGQELLL